jgi:hypothetical protein
LCDNEFAEVDEFYACEVAYGNPPTPGGAYPLHGAKLENNRLQVGLQQMSPWDPWCALQEPLEVEPCFFTSGSPEAFSYSRTYCSLGGRSVDCGWLSLTQSGICRCTSTECFATVGGSGEALDARLNDAGDELVGSFRGATVYLFLEE